MKESEPKTIKTSDGEEIVVKDEDKAPKRAEDGIIAPPVERQPPYNDGS